MVQDASQALQVGAVPASVAAKPAKVRTQPRFDWKSLATGAGLFLLSMGILLAIWTALSWAPNFKIGPMQVHWTPPSKFLPTPLVTVQALGVMLAKPFFVQSDGTMGVGNLVFASLGRVFMGFGIASLLAIPLGIAMGLMPHIKQVMDPIASVMRPVSPLAWFPLSQLVLRALGDQTTPMAIVATIGICCLWPTLMNTAFGVASLPDDFKTVSRVFQFSTTRFLSKVLLPFALPHILTGLRLSMGIAWLVIVAAEMLSGSSGIGFSAYDAYNNGRYDEMVATIIVIGAVGLILDRMFDVLQGRFSYEAKK